MATKRKALYLVGNEIPPMLRRQLVKEARELRMPITRHLVGVLSTITSEDRIARSKSHHYGIPGAEVSAL